MPKEVIKNSEDTVEKLKPEIEIGREQSVEQVVGDTHSFIDIESEKASSKKVEGEEFKGVIEDANFKIDKLKADTENEIKDLEGEEEILSDKEYEEIYWEANSDNGETAQTSVYNSKGFKDWTKRYLENQKQKDIENEKQRKQEEQVEQSQPSNVDKEVDMGELDQKFLAEDFDKMAPIRIEEFSNSVKYYNDKVDELKNRQEELKSYASQMYRERYQQKDTGHRVEVGKDIGIIVREKEIKELEHVVAIAKDIVFNQSENLVRYKQTLENKSTEINLSEKEKNKIKSQIEKLLEEAQK